MKLGFVASVPFIGFGFADNLIMILAGDAIDEHLGAVVGLSTLAAAGIGNLLSDIVGIGTGDVIERWCHNLGLREPPLTTAQHMLEVTRRVKTVASVIGISIGCIIGMFPLLFMRDRKALFFEEKELELFQTVFQPYGVSAQSFFDLLHVAKWRKVHAGELLVESGTVMTRVIILASGECVAKTPDGEPIFRYFGRNTVRDGLCDDSGSSPITMRGSIIGGTALVDVSVVDKPYPNMVFADTEVELLEWDISKLKEEMERNKSIEAAMFSTLYFDLVDNLKRANEESTTPPEEEEEKASSVAYAGFRILVNAVVSDGRIHLREREMVSEYMMVNGLNRKDLLDLLDEAGWTEKEWKDGIKFDSSALDDKIKQIPGMLRKSGISSRVTAGTPETIDTTDQNQSGKTK